MTQTQMRDSLTRSDHMYDQQDYLAFIALVNSNKNVGRDCNSK